MGVKLTQGAIEALAKGLPVYKPVLQLLNISKIPSNAGPIKYRLMMSDGRHYCSSLLLSPKLNTPPQEELLVPNCVCMLKNTTFNSLADGRNVVMVLEMELLLSAEKTGRMIGNPTPYGQDGKMASSLVSPSASAFPDWSAAGTFYMSNKRALSPPRGFGSPMKTTNTFPLVTTCPIVHLNPYHVKGCIKVRVTNKFSMRTWNNSKGEGKLFSFDVVDGSGEIKITAFNKEVDRFYSLVEQGKVYYISQTTMKLANKHFSSLKNDYELALNANSTIVPCEDSRDIPVLQCDFVPIAELENRDKDAVIDVIGVCTSAEELSHITNKANREVSKRAINLVDTTATEVTVTLWGAEAERFDCSGRPVVAIKGARLSHYGGRSLTLYFCSTLMIHPDIPEAAALRAWYDRVGYAVASTSLTTWIGGSGGRINWKTLRDIKNENLGHGEKADYFSCVATLLHIRKETCLYQACPTADCNKKVIEQRSGRYRCEKCNLEFPNFKYRLLLTAILGDCGDNQWVTFFQETAEVLLGQSAETLGHLRDTDDVAFDEVFEKASYTTHIFKNRAKLETFYDETRVRVTVVGVQPIDHMEYSRWLLSNIRKMAG